MICIFKAMHYCQLMYLRTFKLEIKELDPAHFLSLPGLAQEAGNKSKYVLYYKNLHLYLSLGMKLAKAHRILKFKQFIG